MVIEVIRVLIADDHDLVREGLKSLISGIPDMEIVGEAASASEMFACLQDLPVDIVLLDISMPGPGFVNTLERLDDEHASVPVLVLTVHPEERFAIRAIQLGAKGYVTKDRDSAELLRAIRAVCDGNLFLSTNVLNDFVDTVRQYEESLPHERLTAREYEIFLRLCEGERVGDIAKTLDLSPKTVSTHRKRILEKTGLGNNAGMIRYAVDHDLLP